MDWPFNLPSYMPASEYGEGLQSCMAEFERTYLTRDETVVKSIRAGKDGSELKEDILNAKELANVCRSDGPAFFRFFFLNRFLIGHDHNAAIPKDAKRLRMTGSAFRAMLSHFEVPPAFVWSLSRPELPFSHGHRCQETRPAGVVRHLWYILPVRVQVACTDKKKSHALSTAGSNQMDPSHYLHLNDVEVDIRGSHIGLFSQFNEKTQVTSVMCVNLQDGRWKQIAEEPQRRVREVLEHAASRKKAEDPFFVHLILFTSVARWWSNALSGFNDQLIAHEHYLQERMSDSDAVLADFTNDINGALHTMAAHLQRYKSEISTLEDTVQYVLSLWLDLQPGNDFNSALGPSNTNAAEIPSQTSQSFLHVQIQFKALNRFVSELDSKAKTILALLFNNMQVSNDRLMVSTGEDTRNILKASRVEAKHTRRMARQNQRMSQEMRKDSISMKTIAILTMFFLPGTSYAAILAMPFFAQQKWMGEATRIWIWVVLTAPSTALAIAFYWWWTRRGMDSSPKPEQDGHVDLEMNHLDSEDEQ